MRKEARLKDLSLKQVFFLGEASRIEYKVAELPQGGAVTVAGDKYLYQMHANAVVWIEDE